MPCVGQEHGAVIPAVAEAPEDLVVRTALMDIEYNYKQLAKNHHMYNVHIRIYNCANALQRVLI